jgi:hypothetical protein
VSTASSPSAEWARLRWWPAGWQKWRRTAGAASSDTFFSAAFEFFGETGPELAKLSPWDKGARLARAVRRKSTLLVLDGLEPLQYPPGPMQGRLKDQAIEALLLTLAEPSREAGLCLVTSRERVVELEGQAGARRLIEDRGYGRRLGELEDAEEAAKQWPA